MAAAAVLPPVDLLDLNRLSLGGKVAKGDYTAEEKKVSGCA